MLTVNGCRERQMRFRKRLATEGIDAVVITDHRDIYYFTGIWLFGYPSFYFPALLYMETEGRTWLAANTDQCEGAVDERVVYAS